MLFYFIRVNGYKKKHAYGLRYNDLRSLNVRTGVSYQYMFTGIKNGRDKA